MAVRKQKGKANKSTPTMSAIFAVRFIDTISVQNWARLGGVNVGMADRGAVRIKGLNGFFIGAGAVQIRSQLNGGLGLFIGV
jgi:hypothetical protein